jgi:Uma2 family endonuclease
MASRLQVAPAEYLAMSFADLDREYVRGEVVERSMPDFLHGETQLELGLRFRALRSSHRLYACSETRLRLAPDLFRIPDIAVFAGERPAERVPSHPPLLVIEIISPDDRFSDVLEKLAEYQEWGVPHIWVVDPHRRTLDSYEAGALARCARLALPGYPLEVSGELFDLA